MKPYFAKYLPVKGEMLASKPLKQKMKLFLCSRDIQVGDKVHYIGGHNITWNVDSITKSTFKSGDGEHPLNTVYKVIGEISPNAVWVKQDDEFDRNDILVHEWGGSSIRKPIEFAQITDESKILIKCPTCKKFH